MSFPKQCFQGWSYQAYTGNNICTALCASKQEAPHSWLEGIGLVFSRFRSCLATVKTCSPLTTPQGLQKHERAKEKAVSFTSDSVQALQPAYSFYILSESLYPGLSTLIHTCSTIVEYFSSQYVISPTTLSFPKEGTLLALSNSSHDT